MKGTSVLLLALGFCLVSSAHRLDEYLQAARIGVSLERIDLAMDLTPGVAIAEELLASIDPKGRENIPRREANAYSHRLLSDLCLEVDGKRQALRLAHAAFPSRSEMESGEGTIRLQATATLRKLRSGPHELLFTNQHLPKMSVYLANALTPESQVIRITRQARDKLQQVYRLSFEVVSPNQRPQSRAW